MLEVGQRLARANLHLQSGCEPREPTDRLKRASCTQKSPVAFAQGFESRCGVCAPTSKLTSLRAAPEPWRERLALRLL